MEGEGGVSSRMMGASFDGVVREGPWEVKKSWI